MVTFGLCHERNFHLSCFMGDLMSKNNGILFLCSLIIVAQKPAYKRTIFLFGQMSALSYGLSRRLLMCKFPQQVHCRSL
jgi:hypothetical protein